MNHTFFPLLEIKLALEDDGAFRWPRLYFRQCGSYGDTVARGAFRKTIAESHTGSRRTIAR
jgi:hypothetical protein